MMQLETLIQKCYKGRGVADGVATSTSVWEASNCRSSHNRMNERFGDWSDPRSLAFGCTTPCIACIIDALTHQVNLPTAWLQDELQLKMQEI